MQQLVDGVLVARAVFTEQSLSPATASLPPDTIRERVVNRAAALGLPVHSADVQVKQVHNAIRIDVLYVVHVDVATYTVDLHFRPAAGGS